LTTQCTFPGYAEVPISWGTITIDGMDRATNVAVAALFTRSAGAGSPETALVWALIDDSNGVIVAARNPSPAPVFAVDGDNFSVTLTPRLGDE